LKCAYDRMGRRAYKKVTTNGSVTLHQRYIYRDYLQIAALDLTRSHHPCMWFITWDSTQPVATRPLAIQKDGTWYTYGWDTTKNICEVFGITGYIHTTYSYTPFGEVSINGDINQAIQWNSSMYDQELGLFSYNFRLYNPSKGKWLTKDIIKDTLNSYIYTSNRPINYIDILGLKGDNSYSYLPVQYKTFEELIKDRIKSPTTNKQQINSCLYSVFYFVHKNWFGRRVQWSRCKDNNFISHVAVYTTDMSMPLGFNRPVDHDELTEEAKSAGVQANNQVYLETRKDIVLIIKTCKKENYITKVKQYLKEMQNTNKWYKEIEDKKENNGHDWAVNGPNCAEFAASVLQLYLTGSIDGSKVTWDTILWTDKKAPRPEEYRKYLMTGGAAAGFTSEVIYIDEKWSDKER